MYDRGDGVVIHDVLCGDEKHRHQLLDDDCDAKIGVHGACDVSNEIHHNDFSRHLHYGCFLHDSDDANDDVIFCPLISSHVCEGPLKWYFSDEIL
jgi:hypothetical protein